jgi:hypothetical protein
MFEWEDKKWFPPVLRSMQTDFIGWLVQVFKAYRPVTAHISAMIQTSGAKGWVDLCSGNGGPAIWIYTELQKQQALPAGFQLQLTDLYPGFPSQLPSGVEAVHESVNALQPDDSMPGVKTMFNAFHHFDKSAQISLIQMHGPSGFFVVEVLQPNVIVFFKILFTTTIGQLLLAPFVKPFSWVRILLTYIIPVNLFTVTWDGLVSVLRVSSARELKTLVEQNIPAGCTFKTGLSGPLFAPLTWFYIVSEKK